MLSSTEGERVPDDPTTESRSIDLVDGAVELRWAALTDRGRRREINQDAILVSVPLFAVADGMGGHIGGEIASTSTVDRLKEALENETPAPDVIEDALARAVLDIAAHPGATDDGTGTTVTGVYLDTSEDEPTWVTFNIGDSRVYLFRDEGLAQVTTDHSVVQELIAAGRLSPEEAENHPYGNVITRAVGATDSVLPDYVRLEVLDGDRFVVCSDGLTKELTDYGILHYLLQHDDPAQAAIAMRDAALENGGRDNVSIIIVNAQRTGSSPSTD